MSDPLDPTQLALLLRASPSGVTADDAAEAVDLCVLARLGLLACHQAGIYVLTDAGRRRVAGELSLRKPPAAG